MKPAFIAAVLLCMAVFVLIYTRPLTIEQRCPVLDLSQCTLIQGSFRVDGTGPENTPFTLTPDDPHFDEMIELFQSAEFSTNLRNILPRGPKFHPHRDGDYEWSVAFRFENVLFPNGDTGSGDMLHINNFYGDVDLFFDGEQTDCSVKNQEQWLKDVMSILTQYPDSATAPGV